MGCTDGFISTPPPLSDSEIMRADSDLFAEVMHAHAIKPEQIALTTGMGVGHLRRIMNGQYPPTAIAWRALYRVTKDARLIDFLLGDGRYYIHPVPCDDGKPLPDLLAEQTIANAMVVRDAQARDTASLHNSISAAMGNLLRVYGRTHSTPPLVGAAIDKEA